MIGISLNDKLLADADYSGLKVVRLVGKNPSPNVNQWDHLGPIDCKLLNPCNEGNILFLALGSDQNVNVVLKSPPSWSKL